MDDRESYKWAETFIAPWETLIRSMSERAQVMGLVQQELDGKIIWSIDEEEQCRWVFIEDPSDIKAVRGVFNNDENVESPACFVVVKQRDPSEQRGDVIFDIFRLSPESYLWHFNRVYTPPRDKKKG